MIEHGKTEHHQCEQAKRYGSEPRDLSLLVRDDQMMLGIDGDLPRLDLGRQKMRAIRVVGH